MATTEYAVTGMTCAHCEQAVTQEVSQIAGVIGVEVSASTGKLLITSETPVDDVLVFAAVDEAGYAASTT